MTARFTRPRLSTSLVSGNATPRVAFEIVLDSSDELPTSRRGGSLRIDCELREWDGRHNGWLRRPLHVFASRTVQGRDFSGERTLDVLLVEQFPARNLREDLAGRDEVLAIVFLTDLTGARPRHLESMESNVIQIDV
jgi:hypothetical protein